MRFVTLRHLGFKNCLKKRACFLFSYELNDTLHPSQQTFGHVGMFHLRISKIFDCLFL